MLQFFDRNSLKSILSIYFPSTQIQKLLNKHSTKYRDVANGITLRASLRMGSSGGLKKNALTPKLLLFTGDADFSSTIAFDFHC